MERMKAKYRLAVGVFVTIATLFAGAAVAQDSTPRQTVNEQCLCAVKIGRVGSRWKEFVLSAKERRQRGKNEDVVAGAAGVLARRT
jgi:hypothetical protein